MRPFGRYLIEITTGIPVSMAAPSVVTLYRSQIDFRDVLVVGISQSGESTDTNAFLEEARRRGAMTIGVTNESSSSMARIMRIRRAGARGPRTKRRGDENLRMPVDGDVSFGLRAGRRV